MNWNSRSPDGEGEGAGNGNDGDSQQKQGDGDAPGDQPSSGVGGSKNAEKKAERVEEDMSTPWECDFTFLDEDQEEDLLQRATVICTDTAQWIRTEEADSYRSNVDLFFFDPPWGVLFTGNQGLREDDQLYKSDIPAICDYLAKAINETGTVLIRTDIQTYHVWHDSLKAAHFTVEKVPLVVCKAPSACAQVQTRWVGRTSSAFHYVVAHKQASKYTWNREPSGFLLDNIYAPNSNVITGIKPPRQKQRLKDAKNEVLRPQVSAVTHSSFVAHCDNDLM